MIPERCYRQQTSNLFFYALSSQIKLLDDCVYFEFAMIPVLEVATFLMKCFDKLAHKYNKCRCHRLRRFSNIKRWLQNTYNLKTYIMHPPKTPIRPHWPFCMSLVSLGTMVRTRCCIRLSWCRGVGCG